MFNTLKNTVIFNGLKNEEIDLILKKIKFSKKRYDIDEQIAFRGDKVNGVLIILKGRISTEMLNEEGNVIKIEELTNSDIIAPAFIFGDSNIFPVDLVTIESTEILFIEKKELLKLLSMNEIILENFLNEISNKTQLLSNKIWNNFNNKTIQKKLANYITKNSKNLEFEIKNISNLAEKFGVERPSLSRVLSSFVKHGKIEKISTKKFKILDKDFFNF